MIARLVLELLALLPSIAEDVAAAVSETHSSDPTGQKVAKIGKAASDIAAAAGQVIDSAAMKKD